MAAWKFVQLWYELRKIERFAGLEKKKKKKTFILISQICATRGLLDSICNSLADSLASRDTMAVVVLEDSAERLIAHPYQLQTLTMIWIFATINVCGGD